MSIDGMRKSIFLIITILILNGCDQKNESPDKEMIESLKWVEKADPNEDFEEAIKKGDLRFRGTYGVGLYVPGFDNRCLDYDKDINPINGTTDATMSYKHRKLIAIANAYAFEYNHRMKIYRQDEKFKCNS